MRIAQVKVKNFRLLSEAELALEDKTTVIVGRNNSGKTSLSEIMRRLLTDSSVTFQLEDFSSASYDGFCAALKAKAEGASDDEVRVLIPAIELRLHFRYDPAQPELGPLAPFVIDLDPNCSQTVVVIRYELRDGEIAAFFEGQPDQPLTPETRLVFFRTLRERLPALFSARVWAQDPNDPNNRRLMPPGTLRNLVKTGFINAQRGLDDVTSRKSRRPGQGVGRAVLYS